MITCVDKEPERLVQMKRLYPEINVDQDLEALLKDPHVQAVVIATPASTHYSLVKAALQRGKDVLCEKPLALTVKECDELLELARLEQRILMVGHTFVYNSGIQVLKKYVDEGLLGQIYYIHSTRTNLGPIRSDVNAIFDLATHDFSIFNYLLSSTSLWIC